jgi:hypothetical protein
MCREPPWVAGFNRRDPFMTVIDSYSRKMGLTSVLVVHLFFLNYPN